MAKGVGFAPKVGDKSKSKSKQKRQVAEQKLKQMRDRGLPEFQIFVRLPHREWLPAGVMAVARSSQINQAIFEQEVELKKSLFRSFPRLQKYQDQLEFGYRLKEFPDEPIAVAVRPQPPVSPLAQIWQKLSNIWH
ncbi:MAG: HHL1-like protein [Pseudanabaenaceae cyanobacterium]